MAERVGVGAVLGLWSGIALVFVVVLLPRIQDGDFYEVGDPLVHLGLPALLVASLAGAAAGTVAGLVTERRVRAGARLAARVAALAGIALLAVLYAWGVG
ncbi:hypothetical protein [Nocardioides perillae]|uniref:Uncharacterized protein n=1 Tax=Nocardioides perillae TaxID=1119534 RepID=A0A7Y9RSV0_9ACTN|nr:hypothetical protein [Nocardioides perillae]NYG55720.1 hypothetical protein [Nocardioides perillae]